MTASSSNALCWLVGALATVGITANVTANVTTNVTPAAARPCAPQEEVDAKLAASNARVRKEINEQCTKLELQRDSQAFSRLVARTVTLPPGPASQHEDHMDLLGRLAIHASSTTDAAALNEAFAESARRGLPFRATDFRRWAQVALHCADLDTMKTVINRGLDVVRQDDLLEQSMLASLGTRMLCQLGRLEKAAAFSKAAIDVAHQFEQSVNLPDTTSSYRRMVRQTAPDVLRNAVLAAADLHLLDGRHDKALWQLKQIPADDAYSKPYRLVIATLGGDLDAENELEALCQTNDLPPRTHSMLAAKLVQVALRRADNPLALDRFQRFCSPGDKLGEIEEGRFAMLEIELALRGSRQADAGLKARAKLAFAQLLARWRKTPEMQGGVGFLHLDDRAALVCNLARLEDKLEPGGKGCAKGLAHALASHSASQPDAPTIDLPTLRLRLLGNRKDHGVLIYVPGRLHSAVFVIDATDIQLVPLQDAIRLRPAVDKLMDACLEALAGPATRADSWRKPAAQVAKLLLPDAVQAKLRSWKRVTICGAGMLQNAPLDLLPIQFGNESHLLGERLAIDYTANLPAALTIAARRPVGQMLLAGALMTERAGKRREAIDTERVQPLLQPYGAEQRLCLLDQTIHQQLLLQNLRSASVAHLIGHGFDDSIVFRDEPHGASLTRAQVAGLKLDGLVVILGSCNGGVAPWRRGGNPLAASLAGAMLAAGARCTIVAMTDLQLGRHLHAMTHLHETLATGRAPAEAMLAARRILAGGNDEQARLELLLMQVHGRGF